VIPAPFEYRAPVSLEEALAVLSDMHASAEYRAHLAEVHARRAVLAASGKA